MTAKKSPPEAGNPVAAKQLSMGLNSVPTTNASGEQVLLTHNEILAAAVSGFLSDVNREVPPAPADVERQLIAQTNILLRDQNLGREPRDQFKMLKQLPFSQIAEILLVLHRVVAVSPDGSGRKSTKDLLAVRDPDRGVYETDPDTIREVARRYNRQLTVGGARELMAVLREWAPRVQESTNPRWIPLANGDYDFMTKVLHPFAPDRVFLSRIPVGYNENAQLVVIHNDDDDTDWDVESWMKELACGSEELCELLWQVLGACVRAQHPWNKGIGMYGPEGNNAKGTYLDLQRNVVGPENNLSASLVELSVPSTQEAITGKRLITGDENNVNAFLKYADVVKKLITGDPLFVNPKYEKPYNYAFTGIMVQCLNELLKSGDKSQSFWRRWLLIPFAAQFEGRERKYIKTDYIKRPEVLEYVLKRVLHMDFDEFMETDETRGLLAEAKLHNDPVRLFWAEHRNLFVWDLLPLEFLYELYKAWHDRNKPEGRKVDRSSFDESVRSAVDDGDDGWEDFGKGRKKKAADHMAAPEPLASEYDLPPKWRNTFHRQGVHGNVIFHSRAVERAAARAERETACAAAFEPGAPSHSYCGDAVVGTSGTAES